MDQNKLDALKTKLNETKNNIEKELEKIAAKDEKTKGDWDAKFPQFDQGETGSAALEKAAEEVEEYNTRLSLEHNLELRLKDINLALEKMEKGGYGICEKCRKEIDQERIEIYPEAKLCAACAGK